MFGLILYFDYRVMSFPSLRKCRGKLKLESHASFLPCRGRVLAQGVGILGTFHQTVDLLPIPAGS